MLNDLSADLDLFIDYYESKNYGLYALFLKKLDGLEYLKIQDKQCKIQIQDRIKDTYDRYKIGFLLYVGKAKKEDIKTRVGNRHLNGTPRVSTIRYTLAALCGFQAYKQLQKDKKYKYDTSDESNLVLTNWLSQHTYFKIYECHQNIIDSLECDYIKTYIPPFNLYKNPSKIQPIQKMRKNFRKNAI